MRHTRRHIINSSSPRSARRSRGGVLLALLAAFSLPLVAGLAAIGDSLAVCVCLQDLTLTLLPAHPPATTAPGTHHNSCCGHCCCPHPGSDDHPHDHAAGPARDSGPHPERHEGHAHITLNPDDSFHLCPGPAPHDGPMPPVAVGVVALPELVADVRADMTPPAAPGWASRGGPPLDGALAAHAAVLRL